MHPKSEPEDAHPGPGHRPEARSHRSHLSQQEETNPRAERGAWGPGPQGDRKPAVISTHLRGQRAHVCGHSPAVLRVGCSRGMATVAAAPARAARLGHPCGCCSRGGGGCSARHRCLVTVAPGWEAPASWSGPCLLLVLSVRGLTSSAAFRGLGSFLVAGQPQRLCKPTPHGR